MTVAGEEKNKAENTDTVAKGMFSVFSPTPPLVSS